LVRDDGGNGLSEEEIQQRDKMRANMLAMWIDYTNESLSYSGIKMDGFQ